MAQGAAARRACKPPVAPYKTGSKDAAMWLAGWNMPPASSDYTAVDCAADPEITAACQAIPKSKSRPKAKPETKLIRECIQWCRAQGLFVWRNNTGTFQMGNRYLKFSIAGAPDIIGLTPNGHFLGIECKVHPNKQTDLQKEFQQRIESNKGIYILAYSVYQLANLLLYGWKNE